MPLSESIHIAEYDTLIREVLATGGEFRLYPHGTSMLPLIRQGRDSVALRSLDRAPRKYDILFYRRDDGSYILHRVKEATPAGLTLWGDNQRMLEYGVRDDQIIGYAARIFRDDYELDCRSLTYRVYLWVWQFKAIRRVYLWLAYHLRKEIDTNDQD
jgi:hypothetical protein